MREGYLHYSPPCIEGGSWGWVDAGSQAFHFNSVKGMVVETEHFSDDAGWRTVNCVCVLECEGVRQVCVGVQ